MNWLIGLLLVLAIGGAGSNIASSINNLSDSVKIAAGYEQVTEHDDKWYTWESPKWVKRT